MSWSRRDCCFSYVFAFFYLPAHRCFLFQSKALIVLRAAIRKIYNTFFFRVVSPRLSASERTTAPPSFGWPPSPLSEGIRRASTVVASSSIYTSGCERRIHPGPPVPHGHRDASSRAEHGSWTRGIGCAGFSRETPGRRLFALSTLRSPPAWHGDGSCGRRLRCTGPCDEQRRYKPLAVE